MIERCPHCGSEDGYFIPTIEKYNLLFSFYHNGEECKGGDCEVTQGNYKCQRCRKTIPKKLIDK